MKLFNAIFMASLFAAPALADETYELEGAVFPEARGIARKITDEASGSIKREPLEMSLATVRFLDPNAVVHWKHSQAFPGGGRQFSYTVTTNFEGLTQDFDGDELPAEELLGAIPYKYIASETVDMILSIYHVSAEHGDEARSLQQFPTAMFSAFHFVLEKLLEIRDAGHLSSLQSVTITDSDPTLGPLLRDQFGESPLSEIFTDQIWNDAQGAPGYWEYKLILPAGEGS